MERQYLSSLHLLNLAQLSTKLWQNLILTSWLRQLKYYWKQKQFRLFIVTSIDFLKIWPLMMMLRKYLMKKCQLSNLVATNKCKKINQILIDPLWNIPQPSFSSKNFPIFVQICHEINYLLGILFLMVLRNYQRLQSSKYFRDSWHWFKLNLNCLIIEEIFKALLQKALIACNLFKLMTNRF